MTFIIFTFSLTANAQPSNYKKYKLDPNFTRIQLVYLCGNSPVGSVITIEFDCHFIIYSMSCADETV